MKNAINVLRQKEILVYFINHGRDVTNDNSGL